MNNRLIILQVLLLCTVSLLIGFISCGDAAPSLSIYRGIDFIENYKFRTITSDLNEGWSLSDDIIAPDGLYYYVGFNTDEAGSPVTLTGLETTSGLPHDNAKLDISRFEIFNLVHNGGFEPAFGSPLANWSPNSNAMGDGAKITNTDGTENSLYETTGYCLHYEFIPQLSDMHPEPEYVEFDLGSVKDTFLYGKKYTTRFKFYKKNISSSTFFQFNDQPKLDVKAQNTWTLGYTLFPDAYSDDSEVIAKSSNNVFRILYFTSNMDGYIDDFRIVRNDIDYCLKLTVPYSENGRPDLQPGTYRFSVWFKAEEPADVSPNKDRFNSSRVSLGIGKSYGASTIKGFNASVLSSGNWKQLSIEYFIQIKNGDSLVLFVSPADMTGGSTTLDIGSVLVAFPELFYISE